MKRVFPSLIVLALLITIWWLVVVWTQSAIFPTPWQVVTGTVELIEDGTLWEHIGASLMRVAAGFLLAVVFAVPLGLWMGWVRGAYITLNPIFQMLRPISPIAWIPLAILWFGVGNSSPIYLIFISSVFPMIVQTTVGVHTIEKRYLRAAENFGVSRRALFLQVVIPAVLPQIIVGMRIGLGVAWLVVVAAEMIALRSGLGYLIIDSRNAGNRYDLVIAGMIIIGLIGLMLDGAMRLLESLKIVRWRYARYETAKGRLPVIDDVSLSVREGEFVAIVGPSGCGKSTLMNIVAGFVQPESGSILIDGAPRAKPNPRGILISQAGSVFPWLTVQENLMFGLDGRPRSEKVSLADHYAALVGLKGFEHSYPHELSGGMLKRVELARALVVKPDILYMDEPFSALDALMSLRMRQELLRILSEERHTVMLITHDVEEAVHLADRIFVLSTRPTRIQASFEVTAKHPRRITDADAQALRLRILHELGVKEAAYDSVA
jgi:NitT/TauT family transport system permease protein